MSIYSIARLARHIGSLLLPQDCLLCAAASGSALLCPGCAGSLPRLPTQRCPCCALPTAGARLCGACLAAPPHFDATIAVFRYAFPVDRLVQTFKYRHCLALAAWLAEAMLAAVPPGRHDLLLALPLAPHRLRERGFNQALEMARPLARALRLPLAANLCLRRIDTPPQASLPWHARQRNVRSAFEIRGDVAGKSVLVVDDVMTTGATLNELAHALKKQGAARVTNWVLARTVRHES